jgi:hypothetical protein
MHACRWSACIETTFGMMDMAKKAKKAKKTAKKTAKKKKK